FDDLDASSVTPWLLTQLVPSSPWQEVGDEPLILNPGLCVSPRLALRINRLSSQSRCQVVKLQPPRRAPSCRRGVCWAEDLVQDAGDVAFEELRPDSALRQRGSQGELAVRSGGKLAVTMDGAIRARSGKVRGVVGKEQLVDKWEQLWTSCCTGVKQQRRLLASS
ncbi:unnamed protein product, partial [Polarella glacialis]